MRKSNFDASCQITLWCIIVFSHRIAFRKANRISTPEPTQPLELNGHTKKPGRMNYRTIRKQLSSHLSEDYLSLRGKILKPNISS